MTVPISPPPGSGGARVGRSDPRLVREAAPAPVMPIPPPALGVTPDGDIEVGGRGEPEMPPGFITVLPGDVVAGSTTLAIDFGTGGTSFIRYEHRTVVQPGEGEIDVYARVATAVNNGVINLADDAEDRLDQREAERVARAAQLPTT